MAVIELKARCAGGDGVEAVTMAMTSEAWAAVVADDPVAKDGMMMAVVAGDDTFAIHGGATRAAVVREAAVGTVTVKGLRTGRGKDSKAGGDRDEGEELFHDEWEILFFDLLPHSSGVHMRRGAAARIRGE